MICFFNTNRAWGGGEKWHYDIASQLFSEGCEVIAVAHTGSVLKKKLEAQQFPVYTIKISNLSFLNVFKIFKLAGFFKKHKVETVVLNLPADLKVAGIAARLAKVKRIIYRRGSAISIKNSFFNRFLFHNIVSEILANSIETKRLINKNNPKLFSNKKIRVIYNGIKTEDYPLPDSIKKNHKIRMIGNLGRLEKQKAQHLLLEIAAQLKTETDNFQIIIGGDGQLKSQLTQQIEKMKIEKFVVLAGHIDDVPAFMQSIDIFVLTSSWEGFGYVIAEAMLCEKPVVAFNHSSNPELVDHGVNGFLARSGDIEDFLQYIKMLIDDENLRNTMGKNARKKIIANFDFKKQYAETREFLLSRNAKSK